MRRVIVGLISGLLTLALVGALGLSWALWTYQGPGPEAKGGAKNHVVILRRGAGLNEIASALEKGGAVRSAAVFVAAAQLTGAARSLKAGEYEFPSRASMATVLDYIRDGRVVVHQVTIPEGWTVDMAVEALMKEEALVGEVATPPEGSILPQTYAFERGEERAAVLQRMMDARDKLLADLWPKRKAGLPIRTPEEAIILASIV
ncbi:MAG TPA: endolytic transglycosylase MltG, partial [Caulobacter sp.]|nr:endolytic transglycosylase MltG [Caulobacter sp.]